MFNSDGTVTSCSGLLLTIATTGGFLFMAPAATDLVNQLWQRSGLYIVANRPVDVNGAVLTTTLVLDTRNGVAQGNRMQVSPVNTPASLNQQFTFSEFSKLLVNKFAKLRVPDLRVPDFLLMVSNRQHFLCNSLSHASIVHWT